MKCIVFGGGGFIGSHIVDRILKDGHQVRIFERPRVEPFRFFSKSEQVEWITGDMLSVHDVSEAVKGMDAVVHLVSFTLPKKSNDDIIYDVQTNLVATIQLLNIIIEQSVRKIVFISSGGTIYGVPKYTPIDEDHPTDPIVSYGITKLTIEKYLIMFQRLYGIKSIILRVSNPYGPRQRIETAQGAATIFLYRAMRSLPIEIWGDGSVVRDYIYISDVADAFSLALSYKGEKSIFNIGSGLGITLNELINDIEFVLHKQLKRVYMDARSFDVPINVLNIQRAKNELNWSPKIRLREGFLKTVEWLKEKKEGW